MKVAILTTRFPPYGDIGGVEVASEGLALTLAQKGSDVFIVTSGESKTMEKTPASIATQNVAGEGKKISIYRVVNPQVKFLGSIIFWLRVFFILKKINPDIIHSQTIQMGVPGYLFKSIYKKPYIVWCHGYDVYFPWKFKKIVSFIVLNSADAVIALTENMKEKIGKNFKKKIFILPNGIDLRKFENINKSAIREKYGISFSEKIIIFVGGIRPVKGVHYLIEGFKTVSEKNPEAKLYLIGDGPEKKNLEVLTKQYGLEKKIHFVGKITNQKSLEYISLSDIFVLPSLSEGFPVVILESMASGLPIIATSVRGIPEIIKDGENGFLVDPANPDQIADKLLFLLRSDDLRQRISLQNKKEVKKYSWEEVVKKLLDIYALCIK